MAKITFTENEQAFINMCFEETLFAFIKDPLDPKNPDHILEAINYRNYKIGYLGEEKHKIMWSVFEKLGYGKDGKKTLQQIKEEEHLKEEEEKAAWGILKQNLLEQITEKLNVLTILKKELESFDEKEAVKLEEQRQEEIKLIEEKLEIVKAEDQDIISNIALNEISKLKKADLQDIAKKLNIPYYYKKNKTELIQTIQNVVGAE